MSPPAVVGPKRASVKQLRSEVARLNAELLAAQQRLEELADLEAQLQMAQVETVEAIVEAIDAKDPYTSGHSRRVAELSLQIGAALEFDRAAMWRLRFAALLHDVGKIGVSGASLRKTSRLDDDEYIHLKQHPIIGERIVRKIDNLSEVAPLIRWHHERYDGRGYPDRIKGDDIPLESAIVCAADAYDAMTSKRPYTLPMTHVEAVEEMARNGGTQFSPMVVMGLRAATTVGRINSISLDEGDFEGEFEIPEEDTVV